MNTKGAGPFSDPAQFVGFQVVVYLHGGSFAWGIIRRAEGEVIELENASVMTATGYTEVDRLEISRKHIQGIGRNLPEGN